MTISGTTDPFPRCLGPMTDNDGTYEVEDIVDERIGDDGREEFRVRWRTYAEEDDTWEPRENLDSFCNSMIESLRQRKKLELGKKSEDLRIKEELDEENSEESSVNCGDESPQSGRGRRGRRKVLGTRVSKGKRNEVEKRQNNSRKSHWEHRTLEVLTLEAWNKYGDLDKREISNLYIPDRIPTETEKLLCEFDPEVGRVTRNQLKAMRTQVKTEVQETKLGRPRKSNSSKRIPKSKRNLLSSEKGASDDSATTALAEPTSVFSTAKPEGQVDTSMGPSLIQENSTFTNPELLVAKVKTEPSDEAVLSAYDIVREASTARESTSSVSLEGCTKRGRGRPRGSKKLNQKSARVANGNSAVGETTGMQLSNSASSLRGKAAVRGRGRGRRGGSVARKRNVAGSRVATNNNLESQSNENNEFEAEEISDCDCPPRKRGKKKVVSSQRQRKKAQNKLVDSGGESSDDSIIDSCSKSVPSDSSQGKAESSQLEPTDDSITDEATEELREVDGKKQQRKLSLTVMRQRKVARRSGSLCNSGSNDDLSEPDQIRNSALLKRRGRPRKKAEIRRQKGSTKSLHENNTRRSITPNRNVSVTDAFETQKDVGEVVLEPSSNAENAGTSLNETMEIEDSAINGNSITEVSQLSEIQQGVANEEPAANPLLAEYADFPMPKASVDTTLDELMYRFASLKRNEPALPAQTNLELRTAVLEGNILLARNSLRHFMWRNSAFHLEEKRFGKTLIMEVCEKACDSTHIFDDMLRLLVYAGARLDTVDDVRGRTPLHIAAANDLWCRIRILLSLRSPVNVKDHEGKTPLQIIMASKASNFHVVRAMYLMLEYGADVNEIVDRHPGNRFASRLVDYRERLTKYFEEARQKVLIDMTVKRTITPVIVRGIWECSAENRIITYGFKHDSSYLPNVRYMYAIVLAVFDYRGPRLWKIRMWGTSPFEKVFLNGMQTKSLQSDENGFVHAAQLRNGFNQLQLQIKETASWKKLLVLTQVLLVQLHKPTVIIPPPPLELAPESGTDWRKD